jgi:lipid-binding SYLF domain-containing protein
MRNVKALTLLCSALYLLTACTSVPVEQRADRRAQLDRSSDETVALFVEQNPGLQEAIDRSAGYFVTRVSAANVAAVGGGQGTGVLHDNESKSRTYMDVRRFDLGAGLGVRYYQVLILIENQVQLDEFRSGKVFRSVAADIAALSAGEASYTSPGDGYTMYVLSDAGASIAASARLIRVAVNRDLTDTGLSEISIPNRGFGIEDGRGDAPEKRWWDHKMPFMAQKIIDKGYDLPLPYGLKLGYVNVDQDQLLDNLFIGFNDSEKVSIDFVDFKNASSESETAQLIFDTWVFPFMNVFAIAGTVDGQAPLDVLIDGNGMLEALEIDCSRPGNLIPCGLLEDREITLPITAKFDGNNYGIGVNFAGGWRSFFFTLPISYVYADMKGSNTDGVVLSASPRVGKVFKMGSKGNLSLYTGGSYLDSELTVSGSVTVPETDFQIDYTIDQKNKDQWTVIAGVNWNINRHWSVQAEYNGFTGSRETWVGSLTWRF